MLFAFMECSETASTSQISETSPIDSTRIIVGAEQLEVYSKTLKDKSIGLVINHTSMINGTHLVDTLLNLGFDVSKIFTPEHGYTGTADRGETVENSSEKSRNIPIVSLYGSTKKPANTDLEGLDILVFDIQDVGVRFYTYISTLHYVMEAAAENNIPIMVLDRPNPNIHYIDGPVRENAFKSFVGMHPVPVVYGMTIGEYAVMINNEAWLQNGILADLEVIPCRNYSRSSEYQLPVKPSPNLASNNAIQHYPSLCFFEGTSISVGRGTDFAFEFLGHPEFDSLFDFQFIPRSRTGASNPMYQDQKSYGIDLRNHSASRDSIELQWLFLMQESCEKIGIEFITNARFFDLLAGTDKLRLDLIVKKNISQIRESWQDDLEQFRELRRKYLIYQN